MNLRDIHFIRIQILLFTDYSLIGIDYTFVTPMRTLAVVSRLNSHHTDSQPSAAPSSVTINKPVLDRLPAGAVRLWPGNWCLAAIRCQMIPIFVSPRIKRSNRRLEYRHIRLPFHVAGMTSDFLQIAMEAGSDVTTTASSN